MKKLLSLLGGIGMIATAGSTVVAWSSSDVKAESKNPIEVAKEALENQIAEATDLLEQGWKNEDAMGNLERANEEAKTVLAKADVTEKELTEAISKLQEAIKVYNESPNSPFGETLSRLKASIDAARIISKLKESRKTKEENEAFNKIIDKAQYVFDHSQNVNEIKTMTNELIQDTKDFAK